MANRPLWAEISSQRLLANYQKLRRMTGGQADLMAVVKADAYGHDVLICAPLLAGAGAEWLGVTSTEEAAAVRAVCPQPRILVMSGIFPGEADTAISLGLTPVVWTPWQLDLLERELPLPAGCRPRLSRFTWKWIPGCRGKECVWTKRPSCRFVFTPAHLRGWKA